MSQAPHYVSDGSYKGYQYYEVRLENHNYSRGIYTGRDRRNHKEGRQEVSASRQERLISLADRCCRNCARVER